MLSGHRSAWRRRGRNSRAARIAVPLAIPMALGLTLGIILAVSGGNVSKIQQSALGALASPSGSASAAAPSAAATAAAAVVPPAASFANGQVARQQLGNLATAPVDGAGNAINLNQTAAEAAASMNCTLTVPANPLSAVHPAWLMLFIPPARPRLLVYQKSKVSAANGSTSTQYVCPAWSAGFSLDETDVRAGSLRRFETDQDSRTVPGTAPEVSIKLMTAPFVPLL